MKTSVASVASLPARISLWALLAIFALPIVALSAIALRGDLSAWPHMLRYVLPSTMWETGGLLLFVGLGTTIIGVSTAWLTALCDIPFRRFFSWALMMPLAVPVYLAAYSMVELTEFSGPLQSIVRDIGGYTSSRDYWFPDLRSVWGAGVIFSLVLYPYVYLTTRITFAMQGAAALDVSRSLGASPWKMFTSIGVPMARPAIVAGVALVLMETLNDIGAVEYLGVKTITFAVFETWLNRENLSGAVQLALVALAIIALIVWVERRSNQSRSYKSSARERPPALITLKRPQRVAGAVACALPLLLGLGVPLYVLGSFALRRVDGIWEPALVSAAGSSILVSFATATLCSAIAFTVLLVARIRRDKALATVGRIASMGYAVPGTVLAIGLLVPLAAFDNVIDAFLRSQFNLSTGLLLSGSLFILVYAFTLRFLAVAWGALETGFGRMSETIDMAARGLGQTPAQMTWNIHWPMMRPAILAAFLLVFVETMKELSATILLRPFGFETLATFVYERASQSAVEEAAWAALLIVAIGLLPVVLLGRIGGNQSKKKRGHKVRVKS